MSEHITHIAIYEDTARLILHAKDLHEAFKTSIKNHPDVGLMSSGSRGNHLFAIPFIEAVRDKWKERKPGDGTEEKLAAAIGWLSHRGIDLQVKPNYIKDEDIQDPRFSSYENQIYYDAVTLDKVYNRGKASSISPNVYFSDATLADSMRTHPAADLLHVDPAESMMCALVQQNLLAMRQFNNTSKTPEAWLDAFPEHYQDLSENLATYIEAFTHPDPVKMEKYIFSANSYNKEDELIRLVRDLQHQGKSNISLEKALDKAEKQSHYAQGLRRSFNFIQSANAFFEKKIEKNVVYDQVEIFHEPHRI